MTDGSRRHGRQSVRRALAAVVIAAASVLTGTAGSAADPDTRTASIAHRTERLAENGLRHETHAVYTLDVPARAVHVTVDLVLTNEKPDSVSGGVIREYYFPEVFVPVLTEATNFVVTRDDGTSLDVGTEPTDLPIVMLAVVDLQPDLFYPNTQTLRLSYDLPSLPPRSDGLTRVNEAFATFTTFVLGDPGLTSVQIVMPKGYELELVGDDMTKTEQGDQILYTADAIADPDLWQVSIVARDDTKLLERTVEVLDHEVEVHAWPDDQPWVDFVDDRLRRGLPVLQDLIGQPWPDEAEDLSVTETVSPYLYGYAGWYRPSDDVIEIGDDLESVVVLHELSHMWFNDDLFTDRWVNEALAEEYATRALEKLGEPLAAPQPVDPAAPGALQLNQWSAPNLQSDISDEQEAYGYNTSWFVMRTLSTEISTEGLEKVIAAAAEHTMPYLGDPDPELLSGTATWQRLLDLFDEVGGSQQADALFQAYVADAADGPLLQDRLDTRAAYAALEVAGDGWTPPLVVRREMSLWHFEKARTLMTKATAILEERAAITETVDPLGLDVPAALEHSYESAERDLSDLEEESQRTAEAADELVEAHAAEAAGRSLWQKIGLQGSDVGGELRAADESFEAGDAAMAIEQAGDVQELIADSGAEGKKRAGIGALAAALIVVILVPGRRMLVRHRNERRDEAASAERQRAARKAEEAEQWAMPVAPPAIPTADAPGPPPSELGVVPGDDVDRHEDDPAP